MFRFFSKLIFTIVVGGIGGVLFIEAILPYLQRHGFVQRIPLLQKMGGETNIIERTERIVVEENLALEQAIMQGEKSVVAVQAVDISGKQVAYASGLVLTNDGVVVAPSTIVKQESRIYHMRGARDWFNAELWGIDIKTGLAIFHAPELRLSPAAFSDDTSIVLGRRIFALSLPQENTYHIEDGMITTVVSGNSASEQYTASIRLSSQMYDGSVVFSLNNKVLGLARFVNANETKFVSYKDIDSFLRKTLAQRASAQASFSDVSPTGGQ